MYRVRQEELPFVGSSYEFVGTDQGNVGVSVFLLVILRTFLSELEGSAALEP